MSLSNEEMTRVLRDLIARRGARIDTYEAATDRYSELVPDEQLKEIRDHIASLKAQLDQDREQAERIIAKLNE